MEWDDILMQIQKGKEKNYTLGNWGIIVPSELPRELILRLTAAATSYTLGVESMDRVLKKYRGLWNQRLDNL